MITTARLLCACCVMAAVAGIAGASQQASTPPDFVRLVRDLQSADPWVRDAAATTLRTNTDAAAVPALLAGLDVSGLSERARDVLFAALRHFNDPRKIQPFLALALKTGPFRPREELTDQLAAVGEPAITPLLAAVGSCPAGDVDDWSNSMDRNYDPFPAQVIGNMRVAPALDVLLALSRHAEPCHRAAAVDGLAEIVAQDSDNPNLVAFRAMLKAIDDPHQYVRTSAIARISEMVGTDRFPGPSVPFAEAIAPLARALPKIDDDRVRLLVVDILQASGDKGAIPILRQLRGQDPSDHVRQSAADALNEIEPPADPRPHYVPLLEDADPKRRIEALQFFGERANCEDTPIVAPLLHDRVAEVRAAAARALSAMNERPSDPRYERDQDLSCVPDVIAALKDASAPVRAEAAGALGSMRAEDGVLALVPLVLDPDRTVSRAAAEALGQMHDYRSAAPLAALYDRADADTRVSIISALVNMSSPETVPVLIRALDDPRTRKSAVDALYMVTRDHKDPRAGEALLRVLAETPKPDYGLINAIGRSGTPAAFEPLAALARSADADVRRCAIDALGDMEDRRALPVLSGSLTSADDRARLAAFAGLAKLRDFAVTREMIDGLVDDDSTTRMWAAYVLARSRDPRGIPPLLRVIDTNNAVVRALGETKDPAAVDALVAYLGDGKNEANQRSFAALSLGTIGERRVVPTLIDALSDPSVASAAATALGNLGDPRAIAPLRTLQAGLAASAAARRDYQLEIAVRDALKKLGAEPR